MAVIIRSIILIKRNSAKCTSWSIFYKKFVKIRKLNETYPHIPKLHNS